MTKAPKDAEIREKKSSVLSIMAVKRSRMNVPWTTVGNTHSPSDPAEDDSCVAVARASVS